MVWVVKTVVKMGENIRAATYNLLVVFDFHMSMYALAVFSTKLIFCNLSVKLVLPDLFCSVEQALSWYIK